MVLVVGTLSFAGEFGCVLLMAPPLCESVGLHAVLARYHASEFRMLPLFSRQPFMF
jgi:hypothetical protein